MDMFNRELKSIINLCRSNKVHHFAFKCSDDLCANYNDLLSFLVTQHHFSNQFLYGNDEYDRIIIIWIKWKRE